MRILFLSDAKSYHTQRWVNYFVDRGHGCSLITLDQGFDTKAQEFFIPTKVLPNFLKYPFSLPRIKKIVEKIKPDLVNAHFVPNYGFIGALLSAGSVGKTRPLVISTWGSDVLISPKKSWLHKKRAEYILRKADLVTADAEISAQAVYRLGVDRQRVLISPMGVERRMLGCQKKKEKPYLLILSNRKLEPLYDVATLLRAIPLVIKQAQQEVRFVILGEGSHKSHLLNLAIKLKIESCVEFKESVLKETLLKYYLDSDIYVSTSLSDSTSVSLLEAMNFGLIPIVTDISGNREWIDDRENGFLFPISDHKVLAEKIIHTINEFTVWPAFREKNEAIIKSRAIWEDNMKTIEDCFCKLVGSD